jgi:AcrR family transcriptional regulator
MKRARRPEARPEEILDAALAVFAELGFARAKVEDVAARAGLSKGAVYLYFDSKTAILTALVRRLADRVIGAAEAVVEANAEGDAEKTLRALLTYLAIQISDPKISAAPRLVIAEAHAFPEIAALYRDVVLSRVQRLVTRLCERGVAQGIFRRVEPEVLLRIFGGPMVAHMLLSTVFAKPGVPPLAPETLARGIADMILEGLKKRSEIAS